MKLYFITSFYFGKEMELSPRVPETIQEDEDDTTKRICVSTSIIGALSAVSNLDINQPVYVYETEIDFNSKNLIQPTYHQVFDVQYTGEFWITKKQKFKLIKMLEVKDKFKVMIDYTPSKVCSFEEVFFKSRFKE